MLDLSQTESKIQYKTKKGFPKERRMVPTSLSVRNEGLSETLFFSQTPECESTASDLGTIYN